MTSAVQLAVAVRERARGRCQCCLMDHPVRQTWSDHFRLIGFRIEGLTHVGRATVAALDFNSARRQRIRAAEQDLGFLPPVVPDT
jgi:hypothetical protein